MQNRQLKGVMAVRLGHLGSESQSWRVPSVSGESLEVKETPFTRGKSSLQR